MKSKDSWEIGFEAAELIRPESDPTTQHVQGVDIRLRFETIKKLHEVVSSLKKINKYSLFRCEMA